MQLTTLFVGITFCSQDRNDPVENGLIVSARGLLNSPPLNPCSQLRCGYHRHLTMLRMRSPLCCKLPTINGILYHILKQILSQGNNTSSQDRIRTCTPHYREHDTGSEAPVTPIATWLFDYHMGFEPIFF